MAKKILLIVEGDSDEVKFLKYLFNNCNKKTEYKVYPYRTNIHVLAQELFNNYNDFDEGNVDVKLVLASCEDNDRRKQLLYDTYSDIYMIFDFDPQHDCPHFDTIRRMISYFNDSTLQGKLFINYPMMQSYKHFDKLPCASFENLEVTLEEINNYKMIVGSISGFTDLTKYNYITYYSIAVHHLKKANKMINGLYEILDIDDYLKLDFCSIYDFQLTSFKERKTISVLNTCVFSLIDFAPNKFFSFIQKHKVDLLI